MDKIKLWLLRKFFNFWYRVHPPEVVKYYKTKQSVRCKVTKDKDGSIIMKPEGEKYPFPGMPRSHVLMGPVNSLANFKESFKQKVFNVMFEELAKIVPDAMPPEVMAPAVREIWRVASMMEEAEMTIDMRLRIRNLKKVLCFFLQEDDAYRFRIQWALEKLDMKKVKLTKGDKYYFRAKYFKVDYPNYEDGR